MFTCNKHFQDSEICVMNVCTLLYPYQYLPSSHGVFSESCRLIRQLAFDRLDN